jgi:flavin-dependent dehydrogenase
MPPTRAGAYRWGRALGREHLDTLLLAHAGQAGAIVWQPWKAVSLQRRQDGFECVAQHAVTGQRRTLAGRLVLAAHGSWETGTLPTQTLHRGPQAGDLHGFKAHFHESRLRPGLMPLLAFPGGYGGMVHADQGRTSLSCCIRFDRLAALRRQRPGSKSAEAVLEHLAASCRGVAEALEGAKLDGAWLAAGPIRPGFRKPPEDGIFLLGNAAGEAHPIVAEGISMALQSAWLACQAVLPLRGHTHDRARLAAAAARYQSGWHDAFATRIRASALFAQLAMRPGAAHALLPLLRACPGLLTMAARWSGKSRQIVARAAARPRAA